MLENSLSDGALYDFRKPGTLEADLEPSLELLRNYWTAVSRVFPSAWGLPPRKSRLMHGAGIVGMGCIMDAIGSRLHGTPIPTERQYEQDLLPLVEVCHWTDGHWDFGAGRVRKWNELQNTSKDVELLSRYLTTTYMNRVWREPTTPRRGSRR